VWHANGDAYRYAYGITNRYTHSQSDVHAGTDNNTFRLE
jgi:hypothetical protein